MRPILKYLPVISLISIVVVIGVLSLLPPESGFQIYRDKLGHFLAYAALGANALYFSSNRKSFILILLAVWCYGGLLELLQSLILGRTSSLLDLTANISGSLIGILFHFIGSRSFKKIFGP